MFVCQGNFVDQGLAVVDYPEAPIVQKQARRIEALPTRRFQTPEVLSFEGQDLHGRLSAVPEVKSLAATATTNQRQQKEQPQPCFHGSSFNRMRRYSIWPRSPSRPIWPVAGIFISPSSNSPLQSACATPFRTVTSIWFQSPAR